MLLVKEYLTGKIPSTSAYDKLSDTDNGGDNALVYCSVMYTLLCVTQTAVRFVSLSKVCVWCVFPTKRTHVSVCSGCNNLPLSPYKVSPTTSKAVNFLCQELLSHFCQNLYITYGSLPSNRPLPYLNLFICASPSNEGILSEWIHFRNTFSVHSRLFLVLFCNRECLVTRLLEMIFYFSNRICDFRVRLRAIQ